MVAQQAGVGIGTDFPDVESILELRSINRGILIPRMTTAQRDAISVVNGQDDGLMIYNLTTDEFNYWDGTQWVAFPAAGADNDWHIASGSTAPTSINDDIFTNGNVGIAINNPAYPLDVAGDIHLNDPSGDTELWHTGGGSLFIKSTSGVAIGIGGSNFRIKNGTGTGDPNVFTVSPGGNWQSDGDGTISGNDLDFDGTADVIITTNSASTDPTMDIRAQGSMDIVVDSDGDNAQGTLTIKRNSGIGTAAVNTMVAIPEDNSTLVYPFGTGSGETGGIRFRELAASPGGANYVGIRAPNSIGSNFHLTLPANAGTAGEYLETDGTGTLSWVAPSSGGSDADWHIEGGSTPPTAITDDMFHTGNVGIGVSNSITYQLELDGGNQPFRITGGGVAFPKLIVDLQAPGDAILRLYDFNVVEDFRFATNGNSWLNPSGNVGVGNIAPSQKLHITGNARITGAVYDASNSPGLAGYFLSSTVAGTQWVSPGAAGNDFDWDRDAGNGYLYPTNLTDWVGIGTITPGSPLDVTQAFATIDGSTDNTVEINTSGNTTDAVNAIYNNIVTAGSGFRYGMYTDLSGAGTGTHIGHRVDLLGTASSQNTAYLTNLGSVSNGPQLGVDVLISNSGSGTKTGAAIDFAAATGAGERRGIDITNFGSGGNSNIYIAFRSQDVVFGSGLHYGMQHATVGPGSGEQFGIQNSLSVTGNGTHTGTYNLVQGTGSGAHRGTYNLLQNAGSGTQTGTQNRLAHTGNNQLSAIDNYIAGTGSGDHFGMLTNIQSTGTGDNFGTRVLINPVSPGTHYGIYSDVQRAGSYAGYFVGNGVYTGTWTVVSDQKLKTNIVPTDVVMDQLMKISIKTYDYKKEYSFMGLPKNTTTGFVAQDLEKVFPELVVETKHPKQVKSIAEDNPKLDNDEVNFKSVNYIGMVPYLLKGIQEQQAMIEQLKIENETIMEELRKLKQD